jgi:hypothetical protein
VIRCVQPNVVAYLALIAFVPFAAALYAGVRPTLATAMVFVLATLFLPERVNYDPPGLPPFDKATIAGLMAALGAFVVASRRLFSARPGRGVDLFAVILIAGSIGTALTNKDALHFGPKELQALTLYDGFSDAIRSVLYFGMPFFLGRALFRDREGLKDLLDVIVIAALVYSPLVILELLLSPQLHRWIYGFHQHDFSQTMRDGGFRPMVFMNHGLALAMFLMTASLSAVTIGRAGRSLPFGLPAKPVALFLGGLLLVCHSAGAAIYLVVCMPLLWAARPATQVRLAAVLSLVVLAYPMLRATGLFPVQGILDFSARFSQDRTASLAFRFENETLLVERALQRAWFGWGGYDRARIFSSWGQDISVTDGHWIIILGSNGIVGFVGAFGMLVAPVLLAWRRLPRIPETTDRLLIAGTTLIVALNVVDLLPNGLYSPLPLLYVGALSGVSEALARAPQVFEEAFA